MVLAGSVRLVKGRGTAAARSTVPDQQVPLLQIPLLRSPEQGDGICFERGFFNNGRCGWVTITAMPPVCIGF